MKRFRAFLLAAAVSAGLPALAAAQDFQRGGPDRQDRQRPAQGGERGERPQPSQPPAAQPQPAAPANSVQRPSRPDLQAQAPAQPDRRRFDRGDGAGFRQSPGFDPAQRGPGNGEDRRQAYRQDRPGFEPGRPPVDPGRRGFDTGRPGFDPGQSGYANDRRNGRDDRRDGYARNDGRSDNRSLQARGPAGRIGADWRQDRRFDWRGYRDSHRDAFRIGRYNAPRGYTYGYRPISIGFRLAPYFYASNYWIDDPYDYRLPPVWGSYRWVRYYDDVLLVDLATGEIIDAIQGFFW